jgi:hypothetical protein
MKNTAKVARALAAVGGGSILALSSLAVPGSAEASLLQPGKTASARTSDIITSCTVTVEKVQAGVMFVRLHGEARPAGLGGYVNNAVTRVRCVLLNDATGALISSAAETQNGPTASLDDRFGTSPAQLQVCVEAVVIKKDSSMVSAAGCSA